MTLLPSGNPPRYTERMIPDGFFLIFLVIKILFSIFGVSNQFILQMKNNNYISFTDARKLVRRLKLKSNRDWRKFRKTIEFTKLNIPVSPEFAYKNDGWIGYNDWLGTKKKEYISFTDARNIIRELKFKTGHEWKAFIKTNKFKKLNIPVAPQFTYKNDGWVGLEDWLGDSYKRIQCRKKIFLSFNKARTLIRKVGLKSLADFQKYRKTEEFKKLNIPVAPYDFYKDNWTTWGDFLGTGNVQNFRFKKFISFEKARTIIRKKGLKNYKEWRLFTTTEEFKNLNIPVMPNKSYKDKGWVDLKDWLGNKMEK